MGRLDLSGAQKLPGQMGDGSVIRCDAPQPEVQFTVDGGVTVMKRDDINLTLRGRKHRQTLINIIRCLLVQQSLHFYTDGGQSRKDAAYRYTVRGEYAAIMHTQVPKLPRIGLSGRGGVWVHAERWLGLRNSSR